jgi:hypothetical protein
MVSIFNVLLKLQFPSVRVMVRVVHVGQPSLVLDPFVAGVVVVVGSDCMLERAPETILLGIHLGG